LSFHHFAFISRGIKEKEKEIEREMWAIWVLFYGPFDVSFPPPPTATLLTTHHLFLGGFDVSSSSSIDGSLRNQLETSNTTKLTNERFSKTKEKSICI